MMTGTGVTATVFLAVVLDTILGAFLIAAGVALILAGVHQLAELHRARQRARASAARLKAALDETDVTALEELYRAPAARRP